MDFFAKWREISARIYFSTDKAVDRVHASVDRPGVLGPLSTDGDAGRGGPGRGSVLTGARPPVAPVRQSSPAAAQQREERTGSSVRRTGDGGEGSAVSVLCERAAQAWREGKTSGERYGETRRGCSPFIGGQGSAGEGWPGSLMPVLMALTPLKTWEGLRGDLMEGK
jgi:hypothetical protein